MSGRVIFEGIDEYGSPKPDIKEFGGHVQFDWVSDEWLVVEEEDGTTRLFSRDRVITAVLDPPQTSESRVVIDIGGVLEANTEALMRDLARTSPLISSVS